VELRFALVSAALGALAQRNSFQPFNGNFFPPRSTLWTSYRSPFRMCLLLLCRPLSSVRAIHRPMRVRAALLPDPSLRRFFRILTFKEEILSDPSPLSFFPSGSFFFRHFCAVFTPNFLASFNFPPCLMECANVRSILASYPGTQVALVATCTLPFLNR